MGCFCEKTIIRLSRVVSDVPAASTIRSSALKVETVMTSKTLVNETTQSNVP